MRVQVEQEWRFKKVRSEQASKSAFAFKVNRRLKSQGQKSAATLPKIKYSQEVVVKITGGAKSRKGCMAAIKYISQQWQKEVIDSNGIKYQSKEDMLDTVNILQEQTEYKSQKKGQVKLAYNITFSAPKIAGVKREDLIDAVNKVLQVNYPDNYFLMAYHNNTANPHLHVVLSVTNAEGQRIDIRKKDLRNLREGFCKVLVNLGYTVKATPKWQFDYQGYQELLANDNRNIYQVVDFGCSSYQLDSSNSKSNYLKYRTLTNQKEVAIWGKEIIAELQRNQVKIGDLIKIKKVGEIEVKVPIYGSSKENILGWKKAKRNQWHIENTSLSFLQIKPESSEVKSVDCLSNATEQLRNKHKFQQEKELLLKGDQQEELKLQQKYQMKY